MSILNKLNELSNECVEQIFELYDTLKIPFYVRRIYAEQIERAVCGPCLDTSKAIWSDFDVDLTRTTTSSEQEVQVFVSELLKDLESRMNGQGTPIPLEVRPQVSKHFPELRTLCETEPAKIFSVLRQCIQLELDMIRTQKPLMNPRDPLGQTLNSMQLRIAKNKNLLQQLEAEGNQLACSLGTRQAFRQQEVTTTLTQDDIMWNQQNELIIQEKINAVKLLQLQIEQNANNIVEEIASLRSAMFRDYIVVWKSQQQAVLNGARVDNPMSLDTIQVWFEELATQALTIMQQIRQLNNANEHLGTFGTDLLPVYRLDCGGKVKEVLSLIANNCFIVNNQPPQVMKKGTKFPKPLSTTLILGDKFKVSFKDSTVYTTIINERQAKRVASCTDSTDTWELSSDGRSGELKNEKKAFYFDEKVKRYIADFKFDTQLNAIKRADKRNAMTECVMEEKFCLCFRSTVVIGDIDVRLHTLSLPVVVTSHGSQEAQAVATIMWDNGFGGIERVPFDVPNAVPWNQVAKAISNRFLLVTGVGLNEQHLNFLKNKAFRGRQCSDEEPISWHDFCKESLPERNFSFWDWVHGVLRLFEKKETNMKDMWANNLIEGFIAKDEAESIIRQFCTGYFLLRFSESLVGGILIVWNGNNGSHSIEPFGLQKLTEENMKLADRLQRFQQLEYLYPAMKPKDEVLNRFCSRRSSGSISESGYTPYVPWLPDTIPLPSQTSSAMSPSPQLVVNSPSDNRLAVSPISEVHSDPEPYPSQYAMETERIGKFDENDILTEWMNNNNVSTTTYSSTSLDFVPQR